MFIHQAWLSFIQHRREFQRACENGLVNEPRWPALCWVMWSQHWTAHGPLPTGLPQWKRPPIPLQQSHRMGAARDKVPTCPGISTETTVLSAWTQGRGEANSHRVMRGGFRVILSNCLEVKRFQWRCSCSFTPDKARLKLIAPRWRPVRSGVGGRWCLQERGTRRPLGGGPWISPPISGSSFWQWCTSHWIFYSRGLVRAGGADSEAVPLQSDKNNCVIDYQVSCAMVTVVIGLQWYMGREVRLIHLPTGEGGILLTAFY